MRLICILAVALLVAPSAWAATCTDGTDCYCDLVEGDDLDTNNFNSSCVSATCDPDVATCYELASACDGTFGTGRNIPIDPNVRVCEDYEVDTLYEDTNDDGGSPDWGPWYDDNGGSAGDRGFNSYWNRTYGNGGAGNWVNPEPAATPTVGPQCAFGGAGCQGMKEYHPSDLWQGNAGAHIDILRDGDFDDEEGDADPEVRFCSNGDMCTTDADCTGTCDVSRSGVFDGAQTFAYRVPAGVSTEIRGTASFTSITTDIGYTYALGYHSKIEDAGYNIIDNSPWKHDEFQGSGFQECWLGPGWNGSGGAGIDADFPGSGCSITKSGGTCSVGTQREGSTSCNGNVALNWTWNTGYAWADDFKAGRYHCARTWIEDVNTGTSRWRMWLDDVLVLDFDFDGSQQELNGISSMLFNAFSNENDMGSGTTEDVRRYQDNVHLTAGEPATCASIGFVDEGGAPPASTPGSKLQGGSITGGTLH